MSKTKNTTKTATFIAWMADHAEEVVSHGGYFSYAHGCSDGFVLALTSCGIVAWWNGFSSAIPGDTVVIRKNAPRSHGTMPWVMTGLA